MVSITREISVDVAQLNRFTAIVAKQYDKASRFLKVTILNSGEEMTVENSATVLINARREDGAARSFVGTVNNDGTVTVPLAYWMLELDGKVECDISIVNGIDNSLTTTLFELQVQAAACDEGAIAGDDDYGLLVSLIQEVQTTSETLTNTYQSSANILKQTYEASMTDAINRCNSAVTAAQLVTTPFYIVDNNAGKTYVAAIQVINGKPVCVYDEFTGE